MYWGSGSVKHLTTDQKVRGSTPFGRTSSRGGMLARHAKVEPQSGCKSKLENERSQQLQGVQS